MNTTPNFETLTEYLLQYAATLQQDVTQFTAFVQTLAACCKKENNVDFSQSLLSSAKLESDGKHQEEEVRKYKGKTIKKRPNENRWWARYYDKEGKQHSVYGKTQNACLVNLKQALKDCENGVQPNCKNYKLGEWLNTWAEAYKKPKQKGSTYKKTLEHIKALAPLHDYKLKDLTTTTIQTFLTDIPYGNKREKVSGIIKAAMKKAYDLEYIRRNPCVNLELKKHKKQKRVPLSIEDEKKFVEACDHEKGSILFLIMLYQGLRIGEARALLESDIDFENKTITVNKTFSDKKIDTPKTEASNRVIPLFNITAEAIKKYGLWRYKNDKQVYELWKRICARAGFSDKKYTSHCLRHTFGTRCAEWKIALKTCQKWMGHADVKITLEIYTHVRQKFELQESSKVDTFFDTYFG